MAGLLFVVCSAIDELYRIGKIFIQSDGSVERCWKYVLETRHESFIKRYLAHLDGDSCALSKEEFDNDFISASSSKNYEENNSWWGNTPPDNIMAYQEIYEFTPDDFEVVDYATVKSSDMVGVRLNRESGLIYSCSNLKDVVPGASYYITGNILNNCERFAVDFSFDASGRDIALHVNPRLPQNYIVRNCKINGHWGTEEVTSALPFCLERGKRFALQVLLTEGEFYISFNGTHFAAFKHRLPYNRIQCLQVKGDVSDVAVEYGNVLEYPDRLSGDDCGTMNDIPVVNYLTTENVVENLQNAKNNFIHMPYYGKINSQFKLGTRLHIIGRVKVLPHSFFVNFQRGDKIWPHPVIAFHFNPRFAMVGGKHVICRNSWFDGRWDREERSEIKTDFMPSRTFHLIFQITDSSYHVYLNDKFISEYEFRVKADIVDTVYIQGDIKLSAVIFERQQRPDENL